MAYIPNSDLTKLKNAFECISKDELKLSSSEFIDIVINADCWNKEDESRWLHYIGRETHYHIENDGWEWDEKEQKLTRHSIEVSQEEYGKERDRVINAYVRFIVHQLSHKDRYKYVNFIPSLEGAVSIEED